MSFTTFTPALSIWPSTSGGPASSVTNTSVGFIERIPSADNVRA